MTRKVRIIETGAVFDSAVHCAEVVHGSAHVIRQVCEGMKASHMGHTYEYASDHKKYNSRSK